MTLKDIIKVMTLKGYKVFENDKKPFNLNYIGIRDLSSANTFNDLFVMFWKYKGQWSSFYWYGTTDPGLYWLNDTMGNSLGTAILKENQYRGAWKLGKHRGKYDALVQKKEVTVIRDGNKDGILDLEGTEHTGFFSINHHRANAKTESIQVNKWSAGCQVTADPHNYDVAIQIWKESAEVWGEALTYTLLNVNDFK